jgi:peptidoglycan/LPS O-acetylase OafA/YrhL
MVQRIPALDGIRGVAILMVLVFHFLGVGSPMTNPASWGWTGVDLFFVLSGFLIGGILLDTKDRPLGPFYLRRAARVLPPYLLVLGLGFTFAGHKPGDAPLWVYMTFSQNWLAGVFSFPIALGVTWSLAIEEQFYLLAPWLFRRLSKRGVIIALVLMCVAAPISRELVSNPQLEYQFTVCRADTLAFGCLLAIAWRTPLVVSWLRRHSLLVKFSWATLALLIVRFLSTHPGSSLSQIFSVIAVFFALSIWIVIESGPTWLQWQPLCFMGRISYGLYLCHAGVVEFVLLRTHSPLTALAIGVPAAIVISALSWEYLESPLLRCSKSFFTPYRSAAIQAES